MLFAIGTRVKLLTTGDEGVIVESLGSDMFSIYLEDMDIEIPAFETNLQRVDKQATSNIGHIVKGKQPKTIENPKRIEPNVQYLSLRGQGVLLAFEPIHLSDGTTDYYQLHLINDTANAILFTFQWLLDERLISKQNGKLEAQSSSMLERMNFDALNDFPSAQISCWQLTTAGTKGECSKSIKIKPKQFFNRIKTAPILSKFAHIYTIFETLTPTSNTSKTKENLKERIRHKRYESAKPDYYKVYDVQAYAEFSHEFDLHIEKLVGDASSLDKTRILQVQLDHFERYLSKAVRLGVPSVFVIHGIGKGTLKNNIASQLVQHPDVKTFKNEYHPKYGWGATEIILK